MQINDGIQHGSACLDYAAVFLFGTRLKPSGVFDEDHGNVVKVTEANKAGVFIRSLDVDLS